MKIKQVMMRVVALAVWMTVPLVAQPGKTLDIYFVDVEGGQATLVVTPNHQSVLVDTGWGGFASRDANRIVAAAHMAGLSKIDYVVITHYHDDHVGGVPQLAALMPIGTFIDHGPLFEHCPTCVTGFDAYMKLLAKGESKRRTVTPGDTVPLGSVAVTVVSSNGSVLHNPLAGGGQTNEFCAQSEVRPDDLTENGKSVGLAIQFGKFRATDLGDLTWDMERKLMCPTNPLGNVSLLIVSHHGWNQSSSPAYVNAVHPEVAIMDNGQTKGGSLATLQTLERVPGLVNWQLHHSDEGKANNTAEDRTANLSGSPADDHGFYIKVSASADGSFSVFNARTGATVRYPAR